MNRWLVFAALLTVLAGVGVLTQMSIAPVPAQSVATEDYWEGCRQSREKL